MFTSDPVLVDSVRRYGGAWANDRLASFGACAGSAHSIELAVQANRHGPELRTHSRYGERIDEVVFHTAYHELMHVSIQNGVHNLPWVEPRAGAHVARAALLYIASQMEAGHCCPVSMTYAVVPALRKQPDLAVVWEPRITSKFYDSQNLPADRKAGITVGMGMTEKQGGSDVRANTTKSRQLGASSNMYALTGHKWFCSAPMSDAFLMLAQARKGLTCFLIPRFAPDGRRRNAIYIQRLKDKLGNRSNASSEIELDNAIGYIVGEEGRGVATIIDMVNHTRLDCAVSCAAFMRQALAQAMHHCRQRSAFGKMLIDQPLMRNVLADLALESEAATRLAMRVAHAYDDPAQSAFKRIASAIAKYWVCKRTPPMVVEALECFGGNGYVEESPMPRLFRESPLPGIWEGSGNVICLDVLRAMSTHPETLDAVLAELHLAKGHSRAFDEYVRELPTAKDESNARWFVERLAAALQASLLIREAPVEIADAFIATRLNREGGFAFGTLPASTDVDKILARASVE